MERNRGKLLFDPKHIK